MASELTRANSEIKALTTDAAKLKAELSRINQHLDEALDEALSAQRAGTINAPAQWIYCTERMPEIHEDVLARHFDEECGKYLVHEARYCPELDPEKAFCCGRLSIDAECWMPAPGFR